MAKVTKQKCRKEIKCSKCGKTIAVGQEYLKGTPFHMRPICRCLRCGLKSYELSSSEYVRAIGRISEGHYENEDDIEYLVSALTDLMDECQDSYDNIPEQLQSGSTGEMLQERIDNLQTVIDELEGIDVSGIYEEAEEYAENNETDPEEIFTNTLADAIQDALSYLE